MLTLLHRRNFTLLWSGQLISRIGDWILWIALPFYVYEQSGSGMAAGAMYIVTNLPPVLFGSLAGVFVDRWPHKRTMIVADLLRCGLILLLLTARSPCWLWLIYLLAFAEALVSQFFTPAKSAILPQLVSQEKLTEANTLISVSGDIAMLIGPALSGILYALLGLVGVVWIDAASFALSALLIGWIRYVPAQGAASASPPANGVHWQQFREQWRDGLRIVQQDRLIRALFVISGLTMIGNGIILVMWIVFVREIMQGGALEYGWVQVAVASGGIGAGLLMPLALTRLSLRQLIAYCGIASGLLLLATFHLPVWPIIFALQVLTGIVAVGFYTPLQTLLQSNSQPHFLGRIFGAFATTNGLLLLVGQGIGVTLGSQVGPQRMLDMAAAMTLASGLYAWSALKKQ